MVSIPRYGSAGSLAGFFTGSTDPEEVSMDRTSAVLDKAQVTAFKLFLAIPQPKDP